MTKIRVAVVDDVEEVRMGFKFLINSSDECECVGAFSTAEDLLAAVDSARPDLVILDIGLPGMSGIECCRILNSQWPAIQIMICTVFEDDERLFSALKAGASGYILKRATPGVLMDAIKELLSGGAPMSPQIGRKVIASFSKKNTVKLSSSLADTYALSKRELDILEYLAAGLRNKEIAEKLFISSHTVRSHVYNIYDKLHVKSRVEMIHKITSG